MLDDLPGGIGRWVPVVIVSVLAIPSAVAAARLLSRHRIRRGLPPRTGVAHRSG